MAEGINVSIYLVLRKLLCASLPERCTIIYVSDSTEARAGNNEDRNDPFAVGDQAFKAAPANPALSVRTG